MPVAETRGSNSRWVGRYGALSDHKNEIPPLHEGVPGEFGLSFFGLLYINMARTNLVKTDISYIQ